jgi:hypothetical protein
VHWAVQLLAWTFHHTALASCSTTLDVPVPLGPRPLHMACALLNLIVHLAWLAAASAAELPAVQCAISAQCSGPEGQLVFQE